MSCPSNAVKAPRRFSCLTAGANSRARAALTVRDLGSTEAGVRADMRRASPARKPVRTRAFPKNDVSGNSGTS